MKREDSVKAATGFFVEAEIDPGPRGVENLAEFLRGCHDGAIDKATEACARLNAEAMDRGDDGICLGDLEVALQVLKVGL